MEKIYLIAIWVLFLLTLLSFNGCYTNPPTEASETEPERGGIYIESNVIGAQVHIDGQPTGKFTPDTIFISVGDHELKLTKSKYISVERNIEVIKDSIISVYVEMQEETTRKAVLIEDFANVSCIPCIESNRVIKQLSERFNTEQLVVIKFPTNFPSPNDPFYLAAKSYCDKRMSFYNILAAPTIIVNGVSKPIPTDSTDIKNAVISALEIQAQFEVEISLTISGNSINIESTIIPINTIGVSIESLRLHTVIVEERIETSEPPGATGETIFYDVAREMLPGSDGQALSSNNLSSSITYNNSSSIKSNWAINQLRVVVFIQNLETKEILQVSSSN